MAESAGVTDVVESVWSPIKGLTRDEAATLESLGRELSAVDANTGHFTSLIQCRYTTMGNWEVRVADAIGLIGVGTRSWRVLPKIGQDHLFYLLERSEVLPASSVQDSAMSSGAHLWDLMYDWFLRHMETLLRSDLQRGYDSRTSPLPYIRGTIDLLSLSRGLMQGNTRVSCTYEDFISDVPLNRVLKSALLHGLSSGTLPDKAATRTRRLLARLDGVSEATTDDLRVTVDRSSLRYRDSLRLAKHILTRRHLELSVGATRAWCFLWRTPVAVESGVRRILSEGLWDIATVTKTTRSYSPLSFSPDLALGKVAIGDVKYSLDQGIWRRSDVYQLLAFATAHERKAALLVNFSSLDAELQQVQVADTSLCKVSWPLDRTPQEAGNTLLGKTRAWLTSLAT